VILAAANSGSVLGFIGGLLYSKVGARKTTTLGALGSSLSYLTLGILVHTRYSGVVAFVLAFVSALLVVMSSYFVYGAAMAVVTEAFSKDIQGRIMAFHSAMFAMSSGVLGILEDALFPSISQTNHLLFFVSAFTLLPAFIAYALFPDATNNSNDNRNGENLPLLASNPPTDDTINSPYVASNQTLIITAFHVAVAIAVLFQIEIFLSWTQAYPNSSVRPQSICAIALVSLLSIFLFLPRFASPTASVSHLDRSGMPRESPTGATPFSQVIRDIRYQLIFLAFFIIPGSGTASLLVNVAGITRSRVSMDASQDDISALVRSLIIAFSAGSVFSRLFAICYIDFRKTISWKLFLLRLNSLLMSISGLVLAFAYSRYLVLAAVLTGFTHGTFFAITPTLIATWFGVRGFPLNFAVLGAGITVAASTTASWLPALNTQIFAGDTTAACRGTWCYAPTFCVLSILGAGLSLTFFTLQDRIARMKSF